MKCCTGTTIRYRIYQQFSESYHNVAHVQHFFIHIDSFRIVIYNYSVDKLAVANSESIYPLIDQKKEGRRI